MEKKKKMVTVLGEEKDDQHTNGSEETLIILCTSRKQLIRNLSMQSNVSHFFPLWLRRAGRYEEGQGFPLNILSHFECRGIFGI